jgi:transglutaminase-like putative cysteine protease
MYSIPGHILAKQLPSDASELSSRMDEYAAYQSFVTPDDAAVTDLAAGMSGIEDIYMEANEWVYISDLLLNGTDDTWLTPGEFLTDTPSYAANPVPGFVAGDCEEQANTLVSLLRSFGVPPENVRVALGQVSESEYVIRGHVWAELFVHGTWIALDPSQGNRWDENLGQMITVYPRAFDYYYYHMYPVPSVTAWYNDVYYLDATDNQGNAPESWRNCEVKSNH